MFLRHNSSRMSVGLKLEDEGMKSKWESPNSTGLKLTVETIELRACNRKCIAWEM